MPYDSLTTACRRLPDVPGPDDRFDHFPDMTTPGRPVVQSSDDTLPSTPGVDLESVLHPLQHIEFLLADLIAAVESLAPKSDQYLVVTLNPNNPYAIRRQGRRYYAVFCTAAITGALINVYGLGNVTFNLAAGWNNLTFPDMTTITAPSGTTPTVLVLVTDTYQSAAV